MGCPANSFESCRASTYRRSMKSFFHSSRSETRFRCRRQFCMDIRKKVSNLFNRVCPQKNMV
ncbi:hypothetical protein NPIL_5581, partial [Nephila pilipes]